MQFVSAVCSAASATVEVKITSFQFEVKDSQWVFNARLGSRKQLESMKLWLAFVRQIMLLQSHTHTHTATHSYMHSRCVSLLIDLTHSVLKVSLTCTEKPPLSSPLPEQKTQFHMTANHFLSRTLLPLSICHDVYLVTLPERSLFHSVMKKGLFCQFGSC